MAGAFNYDAETADLERRQKIADALMSGGLEPLQGTSAGGVYTAPHVTQALGKLLQAYVAGKSNEGIKTSRGELSDRYQRDLATGMEQYQKTSTGYQAPSMAMQPNADGTPQMANVPGNQRKAILDALASGHPVLQKFAMEQFANLNKGALTPEKLLSVSTPESVLANPSDPSKWIPKRELKSLQAGELLVDAAGNLTTPGQGKATPGGNAGWETVNIGGDLYQKTSTGLKKLDNAPKITTNVTNAPVLGQKAGVEAWSKGAADTVKDLSDSARQSIKLKSQLNQMEALTAGGTAAGPLADAAVFLSGLAKQAGMNVDAAKLNNSQAFNSVATQAWAALMQQNGGARGLVKEESEKLAQSLPALAQTPEGRAQIIATLRQAADQNIADAKAASSQYAKALQTGNLEEFTYGLSSTQLPQSPATPAAPGSVSVGPRVLKWGDLK